MATLYPEIEPHEQGMLDVGDGNPEGRPAVVLHGGPGSGCSTGMRRTFNPCAYRIVLFDQRNCGRTIPHAGNINPSLSTNTTVHLIADIERLRQHLGIDRWLLYGGSWAPRWHHPQEGRTHSAHTSARCPATAASTTWDGSANAAWNASPIGMFTIVE